MRNLNHFIAIFLFSASTAFAQSDNSTVISREPYEIRKTKIADDIYQFTTKADTYVTALNSLLVINKNDALIFDTTTRPSEARIILEEIKRTTNKPVKYIVNSHWHPDHWTGNTVFAEAFPNVNIISTQAALGYMHNAAPPWAARFRNFAVRRRQALAEAIKTGKQPDGTPFTEKDRKDEEEDLARYEAFVAEQEATKRTYPNTTYSDKLTLDIDGRKIELISMVGDAEGTTVMYLPKEGLVATGDIVVHPLPFGSPSLKKHAASFNAIEQLHPRVVIPGHGPAMYDLSYVKLLENLFRRVSAQTEAALQNGAATLDEAVKAVNVEDLREAFTHGDAELNNDFTQLVRRFVGRAIRDAREQDYT